MRVGLCGWAVAGARGAVAFRRGRRRAVCTAGGVGGGVDDGADGEGLDVEARAWGDAAARAAHALGGGGGGVGGLRAGELAAFCAAKGVGGGVEPWDAGALRAAATQYAADARAARRRRGAVWDALRDDAARAALLHRVCNAEGDATYIDPASGYTVFAAVGHLRRGNCCGVTTGEGGELIRTHRCRHCPYDPRGALLSNRWRRLQRRIPLLDYVRRQARLLAEGDNAEAAPPPAPLLTPAQIGEKRRAAAAAAVRSLPAPPAAQEQGAAEGARAKQAKCADCRDTKQTLCTRCSGFRILICPETALCPQCEGRGVHACMECTPWRPPTVTKFGG